MVSDRCCALSHLLFLGSHSLILVIMKPDVLFRIPHLDPPENTSNPSFNAPQKSQEKPIFLRNSSINHKQSR